MTHRAALTALATIMFAASSAANAQITPGGCGEIIVEGCTPTPTGPTPPPPPPPEVIYSGAFTYFLPDSSGVVQGIIGNDRTYSILGTGPNEVPFPDGTTYLGNIGFGVLTPVDQQGGYAGAKAIPGTTQWASSHMQLIYRVTIKADDAAEADAIEAKLAGLGNVLANAEGKWYTTVTNVGSIHVQAVSGYSLSAFTGQHVFSRMCDKTGLTGIQQCGLGDYVLPVGFVRGSAETGGNPLHFYSDISLSASAYAETDSYASGHIDPVLKFSNALQGINFSYSVGNSTFFAPLFAPEPGSWAMMLGGFGLIGGALRTRRRKLVAA